MLAAATRPSVLLRTPVSTRPFARFASTHQHKVVIVGGGTAGVSVAAQLERAFYAENRPLKEGDIAIVEPAQTHHYQPGWTLVGAGLQPLSLMHKPMNEVIPQGVKRYETAVSTFQPDQNQVTTSDDSKIKYDFLVVAPGLKIDFDAIKGLREGLENPSGPVSSIYSVDSCEKTWRNIQGFKEGRAIFTQPAGIIKCAGAPQKILWMAESQWRKDGVREQIEPIFATGAPTMFGVPKYSAALEKIRQQRSVTGLFNHNLVEIDNKRRVATFATPEGGKKEEEFGFLHVVPPQRAPDFVKSSPLADAAGWVSVDPSTTQHTKYPNIFSLGDASSMPNSKTAAAITAQAPVLVDNLRAAHDGKELGAKYDGYASCPLLTGHDELMLAEFKYGGIPKETFAPLLGSQDVPNRFYYHLKKDFFPRVYWSALVKGVWFGTRGPFRPIDYLYQPSSA
ncbi:hypothetical protein NBRC10513v2_007758 [Rhodotorula toruloides]|uniref:Sulfide:quinone oxidoreductase, mitochondrial n=1 Tax=Rhodotorula toruloides TaxID=5286 RepID=A0A2T0ABX1_RHOTO|nr:FAD/NAD(P)-binding domain-containing protein [Rhodotorula toruloides]